MDSVIATPRRLPPLHALAAFEAAARLGSFARAAEELCLTNSAVSHRIKALEDSVGQRLFLRHNRSLALTDAGRDFLLEVRDVLDRLQRAAARIDGSRRTKLRVSIAPAFASAWLAPRVGDFHMRHPRIDLEIDCSSRYASLEDREADVGIRIRFDGGGWNGYHAGRLAGEELLPMASPAYLASAGAIREPADLAGRVLLRNGRYAWQPWFRAAGLPWPEPEGGPSFTEVDVMLEAAAFGAGVALGGRVAAAPFLADGRLVPVTSARLVGAAAYFAVCLPDALERPEVASFMEWLAAQAAA